MKLDKYQRRISQQIAFPDCIEAKPVDIFPETEYLTSVLDSKPFFYQSNDILEPFEEDVKASFKAIVSESKKPKVLATIKPESIISTVDVKKEEPENEQKQVLAIEQEPVAISSKYATNEQGLSTAKKANNANENVYYDFDEDVETITEFTSIEHPTARDDVDSQLVSDDFFEVPDEITFSKISNATKGTSIFSMEDYEDQLPVAEYLTINNDENSQMDSDYLSSHIFDEITLFPSVAPSDESTTATTSSKNTTEECEDQIPAPVLFGEAEELTIFS